MSATFFICIFGVGLGALGYIVYRISRRQFKERYKEKKEFYEGLKAHKDGGDEDGQKP